MIDESAQIDARSKKVGRVLMPSLSLPDIHPTRAGQGSSQSNGLLSKDEVLGVSRSASTSSLIGDADAETVLSPTEQKNKSVSMKDSYCGAREYVVEEPRPSYLLDHQEAPVADDGISWGAQIGRPVQ